MMGNSKPSRFPELAKQDLALFNEVISKETRQYRRGITFLSVAVLGAAYLGKSPADITIGPWDWDASDEFRLSTIALALLSYWVIMYSAWVWRDSGFNRLRRELAVSEISGMEKRTEKLKKYIDKFAHTNPGATIPIEMVTEHASLEQTLGYIKSWQGESLVSRKINGILRTAEKAIPIMLTVAAGWHILTSWL